MQSTYKHKQHFTASSFNEILIQNNHPFREVYTTVANTHDEPVKYFCSPIYTVAIFRFKPKKSNTMNMQNLLKDYKLNSNEDYYEMVQTSLANGQIAQAKQQFNAMPHQNKKDMITWLPPLPRYMYQFFFDLL